MTSGKMVVVEELVELVFACLIGDDPDDFGEYATVLLFSAGVSECFIYVSFSVDGGEAFCVHVDFQEPVPFVW